MREPLKQFKELPVLQHGADPFRDDGQRFKHCTEAECLKCGFVYEYTRPIREQECAMCGASGRFLRKVKR